MTHRILQSFTVRRKCSVRCHEVYPSQFSCHHDVLYRRSADGAGAIPSYGVPVSLAAGHVLPAACRRQHCLIQLHPHQWVVVAYQGGKCTIPTLTHVIHPVKTGHHHLVYVPDLRCEQGRHSAETQHDPRQVAGTSILQTRHYGTFKIKCLRLEHSHLMWFSSLLFVYAHPSYSSL